MTAQTRAEPGRIPQRTCVGCRRVRPRSELIRLVVAASGTVTLDPHAHAPGRGAYLCLDSAEECLRLARRRRAVSRSLRVGENVIDPEALSLQLTRLLEEESRSPR